MTLDCIDFQPPTWCNNPFPKTHGIRQLTKGEKGSGEQCCREGLGQIQYSEVGKGDQPGTQESTELQEEEKLSHNQLTLYINV